MHSRCISRTMSDKKRVKVKPLKGFASLLEESDWWDTVPMEEIIAMSEPDDTKFVDARPKKSISLRLHESLIDAAKKVAAEKGIGYQTLFRMWLIEGLRRHRIEKFTSRQKKTRPAA